MQGIKVLDGFLDQIMRIPNRLQTHNSKDQNHEVDAAMNHLNYDTVPLAILLEGR